MEQYSEINDINTIGTLKEIKVTESKKVRDLLKDLKLNDKFFAILINGKKASLDDTVDEGSSIILLPKIAGG